MVKASALIGLPTFIALSGLALAIIWLRVAKERRLRAYISGFLNTLFLFTLGLLLYLAAYGGV